MEPGAVPNPPDQNDEVDASKRISDLREARSRIAEALQHASDGYAKWYNKRRTDKRFAVGDWVLLSTKRLNLRRHSRKLAEKYVGPYQIEEVVGNHGLAYRVRLPGGARIHPTFPITSLEPFIPQEGERPTSPLEMPFHDDQVYEVQEIVGHKGSARTREYLCRWVGYGPESDEWVKKADMGDGQMMREYEANIQPRPRSRPARVTMVTIRTAIPS